jgi:hypothetical protein
MSFNNEFTHSEIKVLIALIDELVEQSSSWSQGLSIPERLDHIDGCKDEIKYLRRKLEK